jgi:hypothetical protein
MFKYDNNNINKYNHNDYDSTQTELW